MERLVSIEETAVRLGLKPITVRLWVAQRKISSCKLGRRRLIPEREIERLIECNTVPALPKGVSR